jgi:hypothetical protein
MQNIQDTQITDSLTDDQLEAELAAMRERAEKREAEATDTDATVPTGIRLPPKKKVPRTTIAAEKPAKAPKVPKTPKVKEPKAPKQAWVPSPAVEGILAAMIDMDHADKKGIAALVKAAVELRELAKHTRMMALEAEDVGGAPQDGEPIGNDGE